MARARESGGPHSPPFLNGRSGSVPRATGPRNVRRPDEWSGHSTNRCSTCRYFRNGRPLVLDNALLESMTIRRLYCTDRVRIAPDGDRPLSGVRVLDLTRVLAGPARARPPVPPRLCHQLLELRRAPQCASRAAGTSGHQYHPHLSATHQ